MGGSNGMFDPGNVNVAAPYFISGRSVAAITATAGQAVARLAQLGQIDPRLNNGALSATPIRVSQVRMMLAPTAAPAATGAIFEILKGTGTPATTGGTQHLAQRRKTSGYPPILATETHLYVSDAGQITGGAFTPLEVAAPLDIVSLGAADTGPGRSVWVPFDL